MHDWAIFSSISMRLMNLVIRQYTSNKLAILIYHRVLDRPDPYLSDEFELDIFEKQISVLSRYYNCITLDEAVTRIYTNNLEKLSVCVTFDDGYADNIANAAPILYKYSVPATIFVSTGFLNGGVMWNDLLIEYVRSSNVKYFEYERLSIPLIPLSGTQEKLALIKLLIGKIKYLTPDVRQDVLSELLPKFKSTPYLNNIMMTDEQVKELQNFNIMVGAHTKTHPILRTLDEKQSLNEMADSRDYLEGIIGYKPIHFAYPNGVYGIDYTERDVINAKKVGFKSAVTTNRGVCSHSSDLYQLPRLSSWGSSIFKFSARINRAYLQTY